MREYLQNVLWDRDEAKEIRAFDLGDVLLGRWDWTPTAPTWPTCGSHVGRLVRLALGGALVTFVATARRSGCWCGSCIDGRIGLASAGAALIAIRLLAGRVEMLQRGVSSLFECSLFLADYDPSCSAAGAARGRRRRRRARPSRPFRELAVEGVHFALPGAAHEALARRLAARSRAGEVVALVGENGSGQDDPGQAHEPRVHAHGRAGHVGRHRHARAAGARRCAGTSG